MEKGKFNRAAFDPTQLQKFVDEVIEGGAGGGGGFEVPSFTATTFNVDLPNAEIRLSAEDSADIIKNKYPLFNLVADMGGGDSVTLTFICNNIFNGTEHGQSFSSLQYIMLIDNDEEVYEIGLNFMQDETANKSWAIKLTGEGGGSGMTLYLHIITVTNSNTGNNDTIKIINSRNTAYTTIDQIWRTIIYQGNQISVKYVIYNDEFETSDRTVSYVDTETNDILLAGGGAINKTWLTFVSDEFEEF